jgi:phosphate/sulfate permease
MFELYLVIVIILIILAISDLIVGVSNDAVNFLNSAIGSNVSTPRVILIVASIGIFAGAAFSSGMMEVARKGIFNPEFFYFSDIMAIFLAVMITDILLLDFFNTIGLPTSTTVSIVFELLGAAIAISLLKILANGDAISTLGQYINSSKAFLIISGIFLSIVFAFLVGACTQFVSRLIFTFKFKQEKNIVGVVWSAFAMTAMTYFLLFKGLKSASFVSTKFLSDLYGDLFMWMAICFATWLIIMYILDRSKVSVFKIVVLFGTFALAMAFAGNDLVNFIGVPIAGLESFQGWVGSGLSPEEYSMDILQKPIQTKFYLLTFAGIIMTITLWFSRKARSVTETEVNLGRQSEGYERFAPNFLARGIVKSSLYLSG